MHSVNAVMIASVDFPLIDLDFMTDLAWRLIVTMGYILQLRELEQVLNS